MRRPVAGCAAGSGGAAATPGGAVGAGARSGVGGFIAGKVTASSTFWLNPFELADAGATEQNPEETDRLLTLVLDGLRRR
jgi:hypothetical protein